MYIIPVMRTILTNFCSVNGVETSLLCYRLNLRSRYNLRSDTKNKYKVKVDKRNVETLTGRTDKRGRKLVFDLSRNQNERTQCKRNSQWL